MVRSGLAFLHQSPRITPLEERFGLKTEEWSQALVEIHSLISAKHGRLQHKVYAQRATQQRNEALAELTE
ncbi:MAG: hypothetical protein AAF992_09440 [Bacteroidota bacterium]